MWRFDLAPLPLDLHRRREDIPTLADGELYAWRYRSHDLQVDVTFREGLGRRLSVGGGRARTAAVCLAPLIDAPRLASYSRISGAVGRRQSGSSVQPPPNAL